MELIGTSYSRLVIIAHSMKDLYKLHCPSSLMPYCRIRLSPIIQDSPLMPPIGFPQEYWSCLNTNMADHPTRPAKHCRLVQPLPNQLPNITWAHQTTFFSFSLFRIWPKTFGTHSMCYAPIHHFASIII